MPALLPHRRPRWTWPVAWSAAAVLLVAAMFVPESWWWLLVPDRRRVGDAGAVLPPAIQLIDLEVHRPPPEIVAEPERPDVDESRPQPYLDPDWWTRSWNARIADDLAPMRRSVPDSLLPRPLLDLLGARATLDLVLAQPDSAVQARLWWLTQQEQLSRNDLDGIFSAIAKARAYVDLKSREAAMYDEFINETVPVPR